MAPECLYMLPLTPALPMIVSDFRRREVNVVWLVVFAITVALLSLYLNGLHSSLTNLLFNGLLLLYMAAGCFLYFRLKRKGRKPLKDYTGAGDLFFVAALTPLCGIGLFLPFLILSMLASLIWWGFARLRHAGQITIPFVGTCGIVMSVLLVAKTLAS